MRRAMLLPILTGVALMAAAPREARTPNDPLFREQLGFGAPGSRRALKSSVSPDRVEITLAPAVALDLPLAWAVTTGSRSVIVAFLDDGFFYAHEDIAPNVWRNPGETGRDARGCPKETNGIDDDADGYVDDVVGWDFAFDDPDPDPYVFDGMDARRIQPYWHSIGALGIVGAKGNNRVGIAGINWDVSLMLLKIGAQGLRRGEPDVTGASRAARAIRFAADHGARVVNWSGWVDDRRPEAIAELRDAVRYAATRQVLFVLAAGNEALDLDRDGSCRVLPQCLDEPNLLNVAELASDGSPYRYALEGRTFGSNFGARRVEIGALGGQFATSLRHGLSTYERAGGTSSAAPVVSGVAALVLSVQPNLSVTDLKRILLDSATQVPTLAGVVSGARAVNAVAAVTVAKEWRVR